MLASSPHRIDDVWNLTLRTHFHSLRDHAVHRRLATMTRVVKNQRDHRVPVSDVELNEPNQLALIISRDKDRMLQVERHLFLHSFEILAIVPETFTPPYRGLIKDPHNSADQFITQFSFLNRYAALFGFSDLISRTGADLLR